MRSAGRSTPQKRAIIIGTSHLKRKLQYLLGQKLHRWLAHRKLVLLNYDYPDRREIFRQVEAVKAVVDFGLSYAEAHLILMAVRQTAHLPGEIAEVGVYQGGSAKLIGQEKGDRHLYLFDTFEGFPEPEAEDSKFLSAGQCRSDLATVQAYLADCPGLTLVKGLFPETAGLINDRQFSFVHLDVDLYQSTLAGLKFFYPRLVPGGVLLSHDYKTLEGVKKAFDEYFADLQSPVIELPTSQCLVIKI